jgi:hypothetical protein
MVGLLFLALGAFSSWSSVMNLWDLRQVRLHGRPEPRTAPEDYATNPYWLDFFARLNGIAAGVLLASGSAALWFRSRRGR